MREPSKHMSEFFLMEIWPEYSNNLKRKKTRADYFSAVCLLCDFCKKDFLQIKPAEAAGYFDELERGQHRLAPKTIHNRLSEFRSIASFIQTEYKNDERCSNFQSPFDGIQTPEYTDEIIVSQLPSESDLRQILKTAENNEQMYLILLFAIRCVLTSGEICSLTPKKIQMDSAERMFISLRDKTGKHERIIKIPEDVKTYILSHQNLFQNPDALFFNKKGTPLSVRTLQGYVSSLINEAGINKAFTLKDIRNLSIIKMLYAGATQEDTAQYAGISQNWMFRYSRVIPELEYAPCDLLQIL